jgi:hypothetical protein
MSRIAIDCFRSVTSAKGLGGLDERLPAKNSLRRAGEASKAAVVAATESFRAGGLAVSERIGVYVGEQQISLDACAEFIDMTYKTGARFASPMLFSESVANNAATHLSLTMGFTGPLQTFIGSRTAGIQAVAAAREDLEAGTVDAGLVVVLSFGHALTAEAYASLYFPHRRRAERPALPFLNGAAAFLVRRGSGGAELLAAASCCAGLRREEQTLSVRRLLEKRGVTSAVASSFRFARDRSLEILRAVLPSIELPVDLGGESFALDPFLHLEKGRRTVVALGEDGTAGLIAVSSGV